MRKEYEFLGGRTLTVDTDTHRVDAYFGKPTETPEESTELAQWIFESFADGVKEYMSEQFCVIADMSDLDDSTLPSKQAQQTYAKHVLANKVISHFIFITRSHGMKLLLSMLLKLSGRAKRIAVVETHEEAEELFKEWAEKQSA